MEAKINWTFGRTLALVATAGSIGVVCLGVQWKFKYHLRRVGTIKLPTKRVGEEKGVWTLLSCFPIKVSTFVFKQSSQAPWGPWTIQKLKCWKPISYDWLVVWNMTFICPYIGNNHPNWLIFFRAVETTNQLSYRVLRFSNTVPAWGGRSLSCGVKWLLEASERNGKKQRTPSNTQHESQSWIMLDPCQPAVGLKNRALTSDHGSIQRSGDMASMPHMSELQLSF